MRPWDDTLITMRGDFSQGVVLAPQPPSVDKPWGAEFMGWFWLLALGSLFTALMHYAATPDNFAGVVAMFTGLGVAMLVPFMMGPILEPLFGWMWPVLKWLLIVGAVLAFAFPFVRDILHGKAAGFFTSALAAESGLASVYTSAEATGAPACGGRMHDGALTAAHRSLPCGSKVRVTNHRNGKSVVVTINDRGPFVRGRVIDMTLAGAAALGFSGLAPVTIGGI